MSAVTPSLFSEGLLLGLALFAAPGPKDTLVIRQGVATGPLLGVVVICVLADALLIGLGVAGLGTLLDSHPAATSAMVVGGAAYLLWFGSQRLVACLRNRSMPTLSAEGPHAEPRLLRTAALLSLANPYAWLDTVVLIGSIAAAKPIAQQPAFSAGAMLASLAWFVCLAIGSRRLAGLFRSATAWRWLDAGTAVMMVYLTWDLLHGSPALAWLTARA